MKLRILKDLEFDDWAIDNDVTDAMLLSAAREIEAGLIDACLGGHLIKKRVAAQGRGKSRSFRTILGYRQGERLVFLHGFAKNEKDNITKPEKKALQALCDVYFGADDQTLSHMLRDRLILEILQDEQNSEQRS